MQTLTLEYLGEIIEKVSGLFLSKAYKKYIISPSGLMNAYLSENENHEIPQVFYRVQTIYCPKLIISSRISGGCISTYRELMIFIKALFGRKLFNKNIFNCLLTVISFRFPCIMCYRCINQYPQKTITLLGKEVIEQNLIEKYL